jgi:hypothetical protein
MGWRSYFLRWMGGLSGPAVIVPPEPGRNTRAALVRRVSPRATLVRTGG